MIGKRLLLRLFPKPRKRITWRDALFPSLFLLVCGLVIGFFVLSHRLLFVRPGMFWLLTVIPWVWWMHVAGYGGLPKIRGAVALATRLLLTLLLIMILAEPRAVRTRDVLSVVYALDVSDSIGESSFDAGLKFVTETASKKPPKDEAGLIVFGREAAVELPPRISFPLEAINSQVGRDATDVEQALSLAAAMLPEDTLGRIVLISDGAQTEGSLTRVINELKSRGVAVDVLPIQYQYDEEVWLERLELPRQVKLGETYEASVVLSSLKAGQGRLVLRENGGTIFEQSVDYEAGKNRFVIPLKVREPGYYEYAATIEPPQRGDHIRENNTVLDYLYVEGAGKILLVTDPHGDPRDWESLQKAIKNGKRLVEKISAGEFSRDSVSLMPYDVVIFVNVGVDLFDPVQLQALKGAVADIGTGFIMVGGKNSFGAGGYHRTPVEDVLPVSMDVTEKKVLPKGALAIILHTCEFPEGNTWGKRITKQAIKVLSAKDEVGVLAYTNSGEQWIFDLTPASEYEKLVSKIEAAQIGDMPSFHTTMQLGLKSLKASDAAAKHMIIISDGDPSPPPPPLVQQFIDAKVSISMVAIFPHGGNDISIMKSVASMTNGRYYKPEDPNELPSIFMKESKSVKRGMIENRTFRPIRGASDKILKGIDAIPDLHGYVLTTLKSRAEMQLKAPSEEADQVDPILATWRFGLGATAAFTSDLSTNWGADWVNWNKFQAFVNQLMIDISRVKKDEQLRVWSYATGNQAVIQVEDYAPTARFLEVGATISGPQYRSQNVMLKQIGPRSYQATVPLWGKGRYQILAVGKGAGREDRSMAGLVVPYSPEYLRFRSNPLELNSLAERTGGQVLTKDTTADDIYKTRREPKRSSKPVFDWFLIALACLVPLDVAVRRVQLDWTVIKGWLLLGRRKQPTTETMSALLKKKQEVSSAFETLRANTPLPPSAARPTAPPPPRPPGSAAPPAAPPQPPAAAPPASETTTSRLLDMKRRRQKDGEGEK